MTSKKQVSTDDEAVASDPTPAPPAPPLSPSEFDAQSQSFAEGQRSALDNPQHPLHHLRNA